MQKWLSSLPILLLGALVVLVSLQAGCGDGDDCQSSRFHSCSNSSPDKETFLEKVNPF